MMLNLLPLIFVLVAVLFIPGLIVFFWHRRPVLSLIVAALVLLLTAASPGLIKTFQAMMIYGEGDPQLMAGGISEALVGAALSMVIFFPLLLLVQWLSRRRFKPKLTKKDIQESFD